MEKNYNEKDFTYVLFGAEAIQVFNISIKMVLSSEHLTYNVGAYKDDLDVFMDECKKWDDFTEISYRDYVALKKRLLEKRLKKNKHSKKNDKSSFFDFLK